MANSLDHLTSRSKLEWMSKLQCDYKPLRGENIANYANFRRTSIICTIGPKTNSTEKINILRKAGLNVVRMNFSHGDYDYHQSVIDNARRAEKVQEGRPLAIALDTKGPEIRTGKTVDGKDIKISEGTELIITSHDDYAEKSDINYLYVDYKNITKVISKGKLIYVDDGILSFKVLEIIDDSSLRARCLNNGVISSKKGVNLPGTDIDLPALSEKDKEDLRFGVKNKVDMIFASFIRRASDIRDIRAVLGEEVFIAQKMMIAKCNIKGKPVICATQMLESMTYNPRPTRAEVSDVANAVQDGADCVMLSGETAKGDYPKEAVTMMHETCLIAEVAIPYVNVFDELRNLAPRPMDTVESIAMAAVSASLELNAGAILVLTTR
ncbi:pyruvate kinase [Blastomyces silverae]|uniref:Pyruvate kinase n=1 Tax=Blastomyces silverae TaxID=2060906 RepID=A0A0H1BH75_9EURO|nr:pyruvate kinase [Blastomyces silverae]